MEFLWTATLLGLLGGLHCAGMCGPLVLALPAPARSTAAFVAGRLVYHGGRLLTYCGLGLVFGLAGRTLLLAGVQQWLSLVLGLVVLAGLFLSPRFLEVPGVVRGVGRLKLAMAGFLRERSLPSLAVLGALNGLLPCGLVYAACAGAAATGGWLSGVAYMLAFGAGTLPVMMTVSLSGHLLPGGYRRRLRHLMPLSVGLLGCLLILRGLSLGIPYLSPDLGSDGGACCHPSGSPAAGPAPGGTTHP